MRQQLSVMLAGYESVSRFVTMFRKTLGTSADIAVI